ncbi:response regulator [Sporomusa termitida]|uniref:Chemotaxis response regulator protein-glutamate methyleSPTERase n=1 Tax=Sporomusa termitida TaxID=2377 RepID=A0A517E0X6_9FIRM|nr:response regulator [Sporomusa termitida]QDR83255.1 Chemotaxis response regulator protein-glutamate methyleSPTERase [Sporomusa termitida]
MVKKIKVLIADDSAATRENICKLIAFDSELVIIGQAESGLEAVVKAKELQPDIILMDINMPGMDGITATARITDEVPDSSIIMMSVQGEQEYQRRAMTAGAKNYLIKPFSGEELLQVIKQSLKNRKPGSVITPDWKRQGKLITVFSAKGGTGKTTIAANLAVALAAKTGLETGIVDVDLQFGDVAVLLNLMPRVTIADLVRDAAPLAKETLDNYLVPFNPAVKVLAAPLRPEQAAMITNRHLAAILNIMRANFEYTVIDTASVFSEAMLTVLAASDIILVVAALDLPTIKNVKLCLEMLESLGYGDDKIKVVLNKTTIDSGMETGEVEESLGYKFAVTVPGDEHVVVSSVNRGVPFVSSHPETPVARGIKELVCLITGNDREQPSGQPGLGVVERVKRLFG